MKRIKETVLGVMLMMSISLIGCDLRRDSPTSEQGQNSGTARDNREQNPQSHVDPKTEGEPVTSSSNIGGNVMTPGQNIVQNITAGENLATLGGLIKQADMVKTLNAPGPYTVFAPTDEAFEALPGGSIDDLMKPENKQRLTQILNNHVVAGKLGSADLKDGTMLKTVGGQQLKVTNQNGKIMVNGANVEPGDGQSSNGVIHVVDKVLMPEEK